MTTMKFTDNNSGRRGFTLIELLLAVSIISLLSSVMIVSASIARAKAVDATKLVDGSEVYKAFEVYLLSGESPTAVGNHLRDGAYVEADIGNQLACEDMASPDAPQTPGGQAYNRTMQTFVETKILSGIPHSRGGQPYCVFNYGTGDPRGFVFATKFAARKVTSNVPNTCSVGQQTQCPLVADTNGDNAVGGADLDAISAWYNHEDCGPTNNWCEGADITDGTYPWTRSHDGKVNFSDLVALAQTFGQSCIVGQNFENICTAGANNGEVCWCHPY